METKKIVKSVEDSFKDKGCIFVELLKIKSENVSEDDIVNYVNLVESVLKGRNYSCEIELEKDKKLSYYRLKIKNPSKN